MTQVLSPAELEARSKLLVKTLTETLEKHPEQDLRVIALACSMLAGVTTAAANIPLETFMPVYLHYRNAADEMALNKRTS